MEPPAEPTLPSPALEVYRSLKDVLPVDGTVEVAARERGIHEVTFPFFPYPLRLGLREEMPLFAEVKGRRSSIYLSHRGLAFNGRVPLELVFAFRKAYLPVLWPLFSVGSIPNPFLVLYQKREKLHWGVQFFHQRGRQGRERWIHIDPERHRVVLYEPREAPRLTATAFPNYPSLLAHLPSLLLFPWDADYPREGDPGEPLARFLRKAEALEEELLALRSFSEVLLRAYGTLVARHPWARAFLPAFLPDGRRLAHFPPPAPAPPLEEDPWVAMASFWDELALNLSWGRVDLLSLTPEPIRVRQGFLLFTPRWALLDEA